MLALITVVVVLDQAVKWWAWRHFPGARINSGGDILVGSTIGQWYAGPVTGALLDLLDFVLLSVAVSILAHRQVTAAVRIPAALMTGGWGSNLLDRLGIHYWTAPGSVRGVVDFMHIGGHYYNIADFFIIGGTPLFMLAVGYQRVQVSRRSAAARNRRPPAHSRARARILALAGAALVPAFVFGAALVPAVVVGAANYGGLSAAPPHAAQNTGPAPTSITP